MRINLHDQLKRELFRSNLNISELDGIPCSKCGKIPHIVKKKIDGKLVVDRTSRIDCDSGDKKEQLETYCKEPCWNDLVNKRKTKMPS